MSKKQDNNQLKTEMKDKIAAEKAEAQKEAEKQAAIKKAELEAQKELEADEKAEKDRLEAEAKIKAKKEADEAVARAKKAKELAEKAQADADKKLAAIKDKEVLKIEMLNEVSLTVHVPGHKEIHIMKKFVAGEIVQRRAFIRQLMTCGVAKYKILEEG